MLSSFEHSQWNSKYSFLISLTPPLGAINIILFPLIYLESQFINEFINKIYYCFILAIWVAIFNVISLIIIPFAYIGNAIKLICFKK